MKIKTTILLLCIIANSTYSKTDGKSAGCNPLFYAQDEFEKGIKKANITRAEERKAEYKLNWKYKLATWFHDDAMKRTLEKVANQAKIDPKYELNSIRSQTDFDKIAWMDVIGEIDKGLRYV